jgi:hypothetical protein
VFPVTSGALRARVNSTGAIAAFKVQNLGGKNILLDKISVRGVDSSWSDVFIYRLPSGTTITDDLTVCNYSDMAGGFTHDGETLLHSLRRHTAHEWQRAAGIHQGP